MVVNTYLMSAALFYDKHVYALFICSLAHANPVIVSSSVEISEVTGLEWVHTAELVERVFEHLTFDWWTTIPIMHRLEDFSGIFYELLSIEGDRLLQWYVDHGWRDAVVTYEVRPI